MSSTERFFTLARPARVEIERIKGSRFLATARPVDGAERADDERRRIAAEFPEASHHCWAWRIDEQRFRFGDDGEPSGTAGRPILQQIDGRELRRTLVVVTRWFGGTRLGAGGLVRAYGRAAAEALAEAGIRAVVPTVELTLRFAYPDAGAVASALAARRLMPRASAFTDGIVQRVAVAVGERDALVGELRDRTAGRIVVEP